MSKNMLQSDTSFLLGEDLYGVSVSELTERVTLLKAEITRIKAELSKKQSDLSAADRLFSPKL